MRGAVKKYIYTFDLARTIVCVLFIAAMGVLFMLAFTKMAVSNPQEYLYFDNPWINFTASFVSSIVFFLLLDLTGGIGREGVLFIVDEPKKVSGFTIVNLNGQEGIKCLECNITSYHPEDVSHKYTHCCNKFHKIETLKKY